MRVRSYEVLVTFYSSWRNPKYQHHPSWDFVSFLIISLMQDFAFVHKLNCSGTLLVNKSKHCLCMYSSMCGHVNLIRYFRWALWTYYCSSVLWTYYFPSRLFQGRMFCGRAISKENFLVYTWACIHFPYLSKLYPRVRRFPSSCTFQPCGGLVGTKIAWRLGIYTILCT